MTKKTASTHILLLKIKIDKIQPYLPYDKVLCPWRSHAYMLWAMMIQLDEQGLWKKFQRISKSFYI